MFTDILIDLFGTCSNPMDCIVVFLFLYMLIEIFVQLIGSLLGAARR